MWPRFRSRRLGKHRRAAPYERHSRRSACLPSRRLYPTRKKQLPLGALLLVFPFAVEVLPRSPALSAEISLKGSAVMAIDRPTTQTVVSADCRPFVEFVEDVDTIGTHGALSSRGKPQPTNTSAGYRGICSVKRFDVRSGMTRPDGRPADRDPAICSLNYQPRSLPRSIRNQRHRAYRKRNCGARTASAGDRPRIAAKPPFTLPQLKERAKSNAPLQAVLNRGSPCSG